MIKIIGVFHLLHSPLLTIFPFLFQTFTTDILYIIYFLFVMFLYTFINGECPISYTCKVMIDKTYIAGSDITYYPEMELILNKKSIEYYFGSMTISYIVSLFMVIIRTNIFYLIVTLFILLIYYYFIRNQDSMDIFLVQEITKYTLGFTICLIGTVYFIL